MIKILYCENNDDGTVGGSHFCLLSLIEQLDRTMYRPIVTFPVEHAIIDRFRAVAETHVMPRTPGLMAFAQRVRTCVQFLRARQIGLVHLNNSVTRQHEWALAAILTHTPYIVHERGFNQRYTRRDRFVATRAKVVLCVSQAIRDHLTRHGVRGDLRVFYDGIDPARVQPTRSPDMLRELFSIPADHRVIGIVGNIREWKGQEVVLRALPYILDEHPLTTCLLVGADAPTDAAYRGRLTEFMSALGLHKWALFTGYQSDPASFMNLMDVVIHASIQPEPFGMVALEAMALSKPLVVSRAGGVVETIEDDVTGMTAEPGNARELAMRVIMLLDDPDKAAAMGRAGYRRLQQHFTVDQYMKDIHHAYACLLANRPVPVHVGGRALTRDGIA